TDNPWGRPPWTASLLLLGPTTQWRDASTGNLVSGSSNWMLPAFSPDSKWLVVNRLVEGTAYGHDVASFVFMTLHWADCQASGNECVSYPICAAGGSAVHLCGPSGDQACATCVPILVSTA